METTILQLLGGSAFAYVVIKEVLTFLKGKSNGHLANETINILREIKQASVITNTKLEDINRNMVVMLERQHNLSERVNEIRNKQA